MKITIALRRVSTPMAPMVKSTADNARDSASIDASPAPEHDGADDGHEQENARQLEREQILIEERLGDTADGAEVANRVGIVAGTRNERLRQSFAGEHHH